MSMTLILWKAPVVDDPDEAEELTRPWYEIEDDGAFEPSADIAIVANELRRRWPWRDLTNEETVARMSEEERAQYKPEALASKSAASRAASPGPTCPSGKATGCSRSTSNGRRR